VTIIHESYIGRPGHPRYITVIELERGMLMREGRLIERIQAGEVSFDFIREIAESTLPFQNISNLMLNIMNLTTWTSETLNLKCICEKIKKACDQAADHSRPPANAFNICGRRTVAEAREEGLAMRGYDDTFHPGQDVVFVDPYDWDDTGRGVKRYPHTYDCILRPEMAEYYNKHDTYKEQEVWEKRVNMDGSPRVMERRVKAAQKGG
jgi:hypothetical protein